MIHPDFKLELWLSLESIECFCALIAVIVIAWANGAYVEREECAKVCDAYDNGRYSNAADLCAESIRARGQE